MKKHHIFIFAACLMFLMALPAFADYVGATVPYSGGQTLIAVFDSNGQMCDLQVATASSVLVDVPEGGCIRQFHTTEAALLAPVDEAVTIEPYGSDYSLKSSLLTLTGENAVYSEGDFKQNPWLLLSPSVSSIYIKKSVKSLDGKLLQRFSLNSILYEGTAEEFVQMEISHTPLSGFGKNVFTEVNDPTDQKYHPIVPPPPAVIKHLVFWHVEGKTTTSTTFVQGTPVSYSGDTPTKAPEGGVYYAFMGWKDENGHTYRAKEDGILYLVNASDKVTDTPLTLYDTVQLTAYFVTWDGDDSWGKLY